VLLQHGENPEAVVRLPRLYQGTVDEAAAATAAAYEAFAERCHAFEDARHA
jgi:hypothetical protein